MHYNKGKTPLVVFPLLFASQTKFTLSGALEVLGISPSAEGDQRHTALDSCRLLKKAGENFYYGGASHSSVSFPTSFDARISTSALTSVIAPMAKSASPHTSSAAAHAPIITAAR